jgi:hypothetical protein
MEEFGFKGTKREGQCPALCFRFQSMKGPIL